MKIKEIKFSKTLQRIIWEFATLKSTLKKTTGEGSILSCIDYFRTASEAGGVAFKCMALAPALAPDALVVYSKARAIVRIRGKVFLKRFQSSCLLSGMVQGGFSSRKSHSVLAVLGHCNSETAEQSGDTVFSVPRRHRPAKPN
jgi:hypothetical protein